ncbi:MAG: selenocysteine lyase [Firmicutes bacterium]|nr:selenocysteine lyase [Bacillota bacterium]
MKIYLDNAATSWPKPEAVYTAMDCFQRNIGANPGRGVTQSSLASSALVLETRELLAELFHINDPLRIAFTLNVTEALNLALKGILLPGDHLIISGMEHAALARPAFALRKQGIELAVVPCDAEGLLDVRDLAKAIRPNTKMVGLLHASNVTGTIQPIAEVGKLCREKEILFLVDSAQSAGVLPIDVNRQCIDILAFTGHKGLLGPQGTGGIYVRPGIAIRPLKEGGTGSWARNMEQPDIMPDCLESGTLNTPGIIGLGAGVRFILAQGLERIRLHEQQLTALLWHNLKKIPGMTVYGPSDLNGRTAVVSFAVDNMDPNQISSFLEMDYRVVTRAGLHCAPLAHQTIGTLPGGTCRLSPGFFTGGREIDVVIQAIEEITRKYRR